jgi:hypothetical protein
MNDDLRPDSGQAQQPQEQSMMRRRRAAMGYDGRTERRTLRGAARRRRLRTRLWLVTAPAVVVIALVVLVLVLFGGPDETPPVAGTTSTTVAQPKAEGALLGIEDQGALKAAVVFQARKSGGVVLVVPGLALLHEGDRFATVADIRAAADDTAFAAALGAVFGAKAQTVASVSWQTLKAAMVAAGVPSTPASLESQEDGQQLASALLQLASGGASLAGIWQGVDLEGDASGFRSALQDAAGAGMAWTVVPVTGKLVQGDGFTYIEPEVAVARALLSGTTSDSAITVELRNGSGAVGVVEAAAAQLQPLGYQVTPSGNAEDFPNVSQTRILFSAGAADAATRVRALLGVGVVTVDDAVGSGRVVVVLGSDYAPPAANTAVTAR